jgi:hypothetical protein
MCGSILPFKINYMRMKQILKLIGLLGLLVFDGYTYAQKSIIPPLPRVDIEANIKNMRKINLSQFTDNVMYIPLETNIEHLIEYIRRLDISDKYILASTVTTCHLYDTKGHFIRVIGRQGRGPGEFTGIDDVALMNDKIYIINGSDMIEYKLNGDLIKRYINTCLVDGKYRLHDSFMINDSLILGHQTNNSGREQNKAFVADKQGIAKYYYKNYTLFDLNPGVRWADGQVQSASINKFNKRIYYLDPLDDTLFYLNDQYKLVSEFVIHLGKYKEPVSERAKGEQGLGYSNSLHVLKVLQTENFMFIDCMFSRLFPAKRLTPNKINPMAQYNLDIFTWYNTTNALGIYNKKTRSLVFSEPTSTDNYYFTTGLYNDIDGGPRFMPGKMVNDSTMLMILYFPHLKEHIASDDFKNSKPKYPEKKRRLEALTDSLTRTEIDVPVLMLINFKN